MTDTAEKAKRFRSLHTKGDPVVLYNVWDAGTAKIVATAAPRPSPLEVSLSPPRTDTTTASGSISNSYFTT